MTIHSAASLMDQLHEHFETILAHWKRTPPTESHLWELSAYRSAAELLQEDVYNVGLFFQQADELGKRSEIFIIAECMVHLRVKDGQLAAYQQGEEAIKALGEKLQRDIPNLIDKDAAHTPLTYRIAQYAHRKQLISHDALLAYREAITQLANLFILHDGNYTSQEETRLKEFYASLED